MISFYDVNIQYNLDELERIFWIYRRIKKLDFIDSEEYLHQAQKSG
jgi:adenylosuccinate synthase